MNHKGTPGLKLKIQNLNKLTEYQKCKTSTQKKYNLMLIGGVEEGNKARHKELHKYITKFIIYLLFQHLFLFLLNN